VNTELCEEKAAPTYNLKTKLLYYTTGVLDPKYRGTGMIVDEKEGMVVGCYKTHEDMEAGKQTKTDLCAIRGDHQFILSEQQSILHIPESNRNKGQKDELDELQAEAENWPKEVRRLNGELLDPRPAAIATHNPPILHVHPDMAEAVFKDYGNEYRALEWRIRKLMGDVFDKKEHLPYWRQKEDEVLEADGERLVDFGEST
jgi:hypothetical protein